MASRRSASTPSFAANSFNIFSNLALSRAFSRFGPFLSIFSLIFFLSESISSMKSLFVFLSSMGSFKFFRVCKLFFFFSASWAALRCFTISRVANRFSFSDNGLKSFCTISLKCWPLSVCGGAVSLAILAASMSNILAALSILSISCGELDTIRRKSFSSCLRDFCLSSAS